MYTLGRNFGHSPDRVRHAACEARVPEKGRHSQHARVHGIVCTEGKWRIHKCYNILSWAILYYMLMHIYYIGIVKYTYSTHTFVLLQFLQHAIAYILWHSPSYTHILIIYILSYPCAYTCIYCSHISYIIYTYICVYTYKSILWVCVYAYCWYTILTAV